MGQHKRTSSKERSSICGPRTHGVGSNVKHSFNGDWPSVTMSGRIVCRTCHAIQRHLLHGSSRHGVCCLGMHNLLHTRRTPTMPCRRQHMDKEEGFSLPVRSLTMSRHTLMLGLQPRLWGSGMRDPIFLDEARPRQATTAREGVAGQHGRAIFVLPTFMSNGHLTIFS